MFYCGSVLDFKKCGLCCVCQCRNMSEFIGDLDLITHKACCINLHHDTRFWSYKIFLLNASCGFCYVNESLVSVNVHKHKSTCLVIIVTNFSFTAKILCTTWHLIILETDDLINMTSEIL